MPERKYNEEDTIALGAKIPRDLTDASVTFYFGKNEEEYSAIIKDSSSGEVAVPLSQVNPENGYHKIKWKIEYSDGTVEVLPPDGDILKIVE